jgi:hypothetical protein
MNFTRRICLAASLLLALPAGFAQAPKTVTITKCQDCSNKAGHFLQSCMAKGDATACQATYKKKMAHCNKKYCNPKTTKVKIKH